MAGRGVVPGERHLGHASVGVLAARLPFPVDYLVLPTLLSFLICVIVVGAAVFAACAEH